MIYKVQQTITFISVTTVSSQITLATTEEIQAISSPNYPESYPNDVTGIFIIYSPQGSFVRLLFWDLSLEETTCKFNRIVIYEGKLYKKKEISTRLSFIMEFSFYEAMCYCWLFQESAYWLLQGARNILSQASQFYAN